LPHRSCHFAESSRLYLIGPAVGLRKSFLSKLKPFSLKKGACCTLFVEITITMTRFLPAHRRKPDHRSNKRNRNANRIKKDPFADDDEDSFDYSPRELLAVGAVLDHLCRGGQFSDSTRVFMKEASRGKRRPALDPFALPEAPGLLSSHLSCLSACSKPPADSFNVHYEFRDDYDVDDGYTIPTMAFRRFKEDSKEGEDFTLSLEEDFTLDEATLETFDEDATIEIIDFDAVVRVSKKVWEDLSPQERLRIDPGFLEKYVNEGGVDKDILGAIALNVAQMEENLQDFVADPPFPETLSPAVLLGLSFDDDNESVNSLAKKMQGMLQRKTSRLFATSDTKGDGQRAVVVRRRLPNKRNATRCFFMENDDDDDDLTFAVRKFGEEEEKKLEEPSVWPSTHPNCVSVLANAPNLPWPPTFPISRDFQCKINATGESSQSVFAGLDFVSHDNLDPGTAATLTSRTTTSQTVVRGNGNARRIGSAKSRLLRSSTLSGGRSISSAEDRLDSTTVSSLTSPVSAGRSFVPQPLGSKRDISGRPPVNPRRGGLLKRMKNGGRRRAGCRKEEGILAPLLRNEEAARKGFEVQQVVHNRFEI
jgi:hypothetical protein